MSFIAGVGVCALLLAGYAWSGPPGVESAGALRSARPAVTVMPVGDSITGATGCWRAELWWRLRAALERDVDFLGGRDGPDCGIDYDDDSRGYSGTRAVQIARKGTLVEWMRSEPRTDVLLLQYGANDLRKGTTVDQVLRAYSALVRQARTVNPRVTVIVGELTAMTTEPMGVACPRCPAEVTELDARLPDWAEAVDAPGSPVRTARHREAFDAVTDTRDGLHPNGSGNQILAQSWFRAVYDGLEHP